MQTTRAADYAVRALIRLAGLPVGERVMLPELASVTGAPVSFLSKVLQSLGRAGLVKSHRGQLGGFEILRAGRTATISSVIAAIDGPVRLNECLVSPDSCDRRHGCVAHPVWVKAQAALLQILDEDTVADLAARSSANSREKVCSSAEKRPAKTQSVIHARSTRNFERS